MKDKFISFIIISKNEEKRIKSCIESVINCSSEYNNSEIILVDSASTDKTIDIANRYPITIIQLKPNWILSPAAGRYIGFKYSNGKYLFFIDGDMFLIKGWLKEALPYLKKYEVAGVAGKVINKFEDNSSQLIIERINTDYDNVKFGEVDFLGGHGIYKRSVFDEVGCYHPFLTSGEESELSNRIRIKNYKLLRLPIPMVIHRYKFLNLFIYLRKHNWEYLKGAGSGIRFAFRTNKHLFLTMFPRLGRAILFDLYILYVLFSLLNLIKGNILFAISIIVGYFLLLILVMRKRKNVKDALLAIFLLHFSAIALFIGFLKDLPDPQKYPDNPIIIKTKLKKNEL